MGKYQVKVKLQYQFDDQRCGEFYRAKKSFTKTPKGENMFIMWVLRRISPRCHHKGHHAFYENSWDFNPWKEMFKPSNFAILGKFLMCGLCNIVPPPKDQK
jgi:hypothetical protein